MVERLLLVRAQVSLGTRHPQNVAMQHHFPVAQRLAVATNQPFQREREQAVDTGIHESIRCAGFPIQKVRQGALRQHVFAPHHGVAQHNDVRRGHPLKAPFVEPIVFAQSVGNTVIRPDVEAFNFLPQRRGQCHRHEDDAEHHGPVPRVQPHFVDERPVGSL